MPRVVAALWVVACAVLAVVDVCGGYVLLSFVGSR